jgi:probable F420-dependent oxidoreductase
VETVATATTCLPASITAGVCLFARDNAVPPMVLARAAEVRGFDGFFVPENTHMPVTRRRASPYPEARMKSLANLYDPFVTLGACAAVTQRIRLGISVCLLTHRDAIATARAASSLDHLSHGRLVLGVAGGFVAEAMENHGSPFRDRWKIVREKSLAMRCLWHDDKPEFHGDFVDFAPLDTNIAPYQADGPPIWIGSNHATVPDKVADYADGWFVFDGRYAGEPFADLRRACDQRRRDVDEITVSLMNAPMEPGALEAHHDAGHRNFIFIVNVDDAADAEHELDELVRVMNTTFAGEAAGLTA